MWEYFGFLSSEGRAQNKGKLGYDDGNLEALQKAIRQQRSTTCFVDFVSVSLELLQRNLELNKEHKPLLAVCV